MRGSAVTCGKFLKRWARSAAPRILRHRSPTSSVKIKKSSVNASPPRVMTASRRCQPTKRHYDIPAQREQQAHENEALTNFYEEQHRRREARENDEAKARGPRCE
jgi:hypothetical protein